MIKAFDLNDRALRYAGIKPSLKIMLENDISLYDASAEFRDNKEAMLIYLSNFGSELRFASERLKNDKDVVLTAVKNDGFAITMASHDLKRDKDVIEAAMSTYQYAKEYLKTAIQEDELSEQTPKR